MTTGINNRTKKDYQSHFGWACSQEFGNAIIATSVQSTNVTRVAIDENEVRSFVQAVISTGMNFLRKVLWNAQFLSSFREQKFILFPVSIRWSLSHFTLQLVTV